MADNVVKKNLNIREYEHSNFQLVDRLPENNSVLLNNVTWDIVSTYISDDQSVFAFFKSKIKFFLKDNPVIVDQILNHFLNELIEHILKRTFRVQFTVDDSLRMNLLYKRFFIEQDSNIRIIFDYFIDDIRQLILTGQFDKMPLILRQAIIYLPKYVLLQATITWLNRKGPESFTTMLYQNLLNPPVEDQSSNISFDQKNLVLFLTIFLLLLFAINIPIIGAMVNCLAGILLIAFVLYYSLTYFKKFNK